MTALVSDSLFTCPENNRIREWTWSSNESFEVPAWRWVREASGGAGSPKVKSVHL